MRRDDQADSGKNQPGGAIMSAGWCPVVADRPTCQVVGLIV
jgi:hypothetical protein